MINTEIQISITKIIWLGDKLGSHPIQKDFIRKTEIFWHNLPKKKGGGVWAKSKKSLSEKTEVVKKGGGGVSGFWQQVKKKQFFYASPNGMISHVVWWLINCMAFAQMWILLCSRAHCQISWGGNCQYPWKSKSCIRQSWRTLGHRSWNQWQNHLWNSWYLLLFGSQYLLQGCHTPHNHMM